MSGIVSSIGNLISGGVQSLGNLASGIGNAVGGIGKAVGPLALPISLAMMAYGLPPGAFGAGALGADATIPWLSNAAEGSVFAQGAGTGIGIGTGADLGTSMLFGGGAAAADAAGVTAPSWLGNTPVGSVFNPGTNLAQMANGSSLPTGAFNANDLVSSTGGSPAWLNNTPAGSVFSAPSVGVTAPPTVGSATDPSMLSRMASQIKSLPWGPISTGVNVGSGIMGLMQSQKMMDLSRMAMAKQDPFGEQRGPYAAQLAALMKDPSSVASLPGYQFGMDQGRLAIQRRAAASGGGGNEDIALAQFSPAYAQQFYSQEVQRLMALAGANIQPGSGNTLLSGANMSNDLLSRSLASLSYGARGAGV